MTKAFKPRVNEQQQFSPASIKGKEKHKKWNGNENVEPTRGQSASNKSSQGSNAKSQSQKASTVSKSKATPKEAGKKSRSDQT
ncbi:MAG: hypothetical protein EZS28_026094 [Streblomastix strix]|uniref:Uncharacterized protein n=1 Tax=Streblomastix strix TaxID=222440 RepID=A0A5J4V6P3_9EUKA|nr:MAG: hypothetical protein EZS28_026094 [Streblomastix strix]